MEWKPNNNHTQWYVITKSLLFAAQKPLFSANKRHVLQKIELTLKTLSKDENVILKCAFTEYILSLDGGGDWHLIYLRIMFDDGSREDQF